MHKKPSDRDLRI